MSRQAPGPRGNLLVGSAPALRGAPLETFVAAWREFGDVVRFRLGGPFEAYLLAHPDHVKRILQDENRLYRKVPYHNDRFRELLGDSLSTREDARWLARRRLEQPAFHRERVAGCAGVVVESTCQLAERWAPLAARGGTIDVVSEMMRLTLVVVVRAVLGADLAGIERLEPRVTDALEHLVRRMESYVPLPLGVPLPANRRFVAARRALDDAVYAMIAERRRHADGVGDLLALLMEARDSETGETLSDEQLRDEAMTIILAGHESTSIALSWTWFLLSKHSDVARRMRAELAAVLDGRPPAVADLLRLRYTRMVLDEALRLYPPAWALTRSPSADDEVGGYRIPRGATVIASPYVTHRHPAFWENPEGFDPVRFAPESTESRHRYAYRPFGGGPRQCIGNAFALMEAQLVLATLAQRYRLDLVPGYAATPRPQITLRPRGGMPMILRAA